MACADPTELNYNLAISHVPAGETPVLKMQFSQPGLQGPDLTLNDITLEPVILRGGVEATRLSVTVRNVGDSDWKSAPHQQALMAHVGQEPFLVTTNLKRLRAGASRTFTVTLPALAAMAVTPDLVVELATDEDIYSDGNSTNDDADDTDNLMILPGDAVRAMVSR